MAGARQHSMASVACLVAYISELTLTPMYGVMVGSW